MNIAVEKELQNWIAEQVKSGRYSSEAELVEQALREKMKNDDAEYFRERRRLAEEDIREGRTVAADDAFFDSLRARLRGMTDNSDR